MMIASARQSMARTLSMLREKWLTTSATLMTGTTGRTPISSASAAVISVPPATPTVPWMVEVMSAAMTTPSRIQKPNSP